MTVGRGSGVKIVEGGLFFRSPCPPPPLPTGILYSPQLHWHQESNKIKTVS